MDRGISMVSIMGEYGERKGEGEGGGEGGGEGDCRSNDRGNRLSKTAFTNLSTIFLATAPGRRIV